MRRLLCALLLCAATVAGAAPDSLMIKGSTTIHMERGEIRNSSSYDSKTSRNGK